MKQLFTLLLFTLVIIRANSQTPIMVCNGNGAPCTPYYNLDAAINSANPGGYVYLPGGTFTLTTTIDKPLNIIGAGANPDSSQVTGATFISGNLDMSATSTGSLVEGLYISGYITTPDSIINCVFRRNYIPAFAYSAGGVQGQYMVNFSEITNCYLGLPGYGSGSGRGCYIGNCVVLYLNDFISSTISHCDFVPSGGHCGHNINNSTFSNCIFQSIFGHPYYGFGNCASLSNVLLAGSEPGYYHSNVFIGTCSDVYASGLCPISYNPFLETSFYTMSSLPLGSDNTVRGIFGGNNPWKMGMVPSNPHIYFKQIPPNTNVSGQLPISIKVRAEN